VLLSKAIPTVAQNKVVSRFVQAEIGVSQQRTLCSREPASRYKPQAKCCGFPQKELSRDNEDLLVVQNDVTDPGGTPVLRSPTSLRGYVDSLLRTLGLLV
jgi:hypothetical protein